MAKQKTMKLDFQGAVQTRDAARQALESLGIKARYSLAVGDTGPRVDIFVSPRDLTAAKTALPYSVGPATVNLHKDDKK